MNVVAIEKTCGGCPTYFDARLVDGRMMIIKYRWSWLTVTISSKPTENPKEAYQEGKCIFREKLEESEYGGVLDENLLAAWLLDLILSGRIEHKPHPEGIPEQNEQ